LVPAGPDNPGPVELACCANYPASNVPALRTTPHLAGVIHDSGLRRPLLLKSAVSLGPYSRCSTVGYRFFAQGDQFFGRGRVDRHGRIKIGLGRAHRHGDPYHLDQFSGVRPDDMASDDSVAVAIDYKLHEHARVAPGQRRLQWAKAGLVDVNLTK